MLLLAAGGMIPYLSSVGGGLSVLARAWEVFGGKSGEKSVCGVLTVVETILLQSCGWSRTRCLPENPFQASMVSF